MQDIVGKACMSETHASMLHFTQWANNAWISDCTAKHSTWADRLKQTSFVT